MPIFRRSPIVGIETPTSPLTGEFTAMTSPSTPSLMSTINRCVLRQCRDLLVRQLDVRLLIAALQSATVSAVDECFRLSPEAAQQMPRQSQGSASTSAAADLLDRMEQTGDDATFQKFTIGLRRSQRHLAAVLEETRNQLRKWRSYDDYVDDDWYEEDDSERERHFRAMNFGNDQLTGDQVRRVLRRVLRSTTKDVTASSSSSNDVSDDSHVITNTNSSKVRRRDVNSTRSRQAVDEAVNRPYIDSYSVIRCNEYSNRKWIERECQSHTVIDAEKTASANDGTSITGDRTWSATLIRSLDFRRIAIEDLPSNVTSPPGPCRLVYVTIDTTSGEGRSTAVSGVVFRADRAPAEKNGYSYTTRRSASLGVGDSISSRSGNGLSTTIRDLKLKQPITDVSPSDERPMTSDQRRACNNGTDNNRMVVQTNEWDAKAIMTHPPPIPPKPKRVCLSVTKTKQQLSIREQHQVTDNRPKIQHAAIKETVPPPLPARVNLVNLRQVSSLPPPPPPPRKTDDSPLFGHVPSWAPHGFASNVQRLPSRSDITDKPSAAAATAAAAVTVTVVGSSSTAATSSVSSDDETSVGDVVDNDLDLDYNVSASSSLTELSCVASGSGLHPSDQEHVTTGKKNDKKDARGAVEDDDYEPITPRDSTRAGSVRSPWSKDVMPETASPASINQPLKLDASVEVHGTAIVTSEPTETNLQIDQQMMSSKGDECQSDQSAIELQNEIRPEATSIATETNTTSSTVMADDDLISGSTSSHLCSNNAVADFMQQMKQSNEALRDIGEREMHDGEPETHESLLRLRAASFVAIEPNRDENDEGSIVYEDIDQYQMMADMDNEIDDDTTSAAYLDPATSSSLAGRLRLLRAELVQRRRTSAARMSDADKGSSGRSYNGHRRRSSLLDPESAHMRRNSSGLQSGQQFTMAQPPTHRTLARGCLLVVVESESSSVALPDEAHPGSIETGGHSAIDATAPELSPTDCQKHPGEVSAPGTLPSSKPAGEFPDDEYEMAIDEQRDASNALLSSNQPTNDSERSTADVRRSRQNGGPSSVIDVRKATVAESRVFAFDREGFVYHIPRFELRRHGDPSGESWFYPIALTVHQASLFVGAERQEGCFVVYRPAGCSGASRHTRFTGDGDDDVQFVLSVGRRDGQVLHYLIVGDGPRGLTSSSLCIRGDRPWRSFLTVGELVDYFRRNRGPLATRLRRPLREARWPPMIADRNSYEIRREDLQLSGESRGRDEDFGMVCLGAYNNGNEALPVAVKILHKSSSTDFPGGGSPWITAADDDDFVDEVRLLSSLRHVNIIRLVGVSLSRRPFYLVTELPSSLGRLNDFLFQRRDYRRKNHVGFDGEVSDHPGSSCSPPVGADIDVCDAICRQAAEALGYLEQKRYVVHRNVSTMSFEVVATVGTSSVSGRVHDIKGSRVKDSRSSSWTGVCDVLIKLSDFSRARSVKDDEYIGDRSEKVFVKWASPEVLTDLRYSTQSDVYALAVVFWEVYSDGVLPYSCLSPEQTAVYVINGGRLDRPSRCPAKMFKLMIRCWNRQRRSRPSAADVIDQLRAGVGRRRRDIVVSTVNDGVSHPLAINQKNPPLPPVGPSLNRARLPHLKTSYSFTASALITPPISGIPSPPTSQSQSAIDNDKSNKKTSSSPPLPRSRDQNQRNATGTSLSQNSRFQPRASTPPPRRKWDCSLVEPSSAPIHVQSSVGQVARGHVTASLQSKSAMQLNLLVVPGGRRKDGVGSARTSSKSSLSSRESTVEGDVANDGTSIGHDWDSSNWTSTGSSSTVRPRNMESKKKSTRQSIRSLFNLANSRDASS